MVYNARLVSGDIIYAEEPLKRFKIYSLEQEPKNMWKNSSLTVFDVNETIRKGQEVKGIGYIVSWPNLIRVGTFLKESVNEKTCFHPPKVKGEPLRRYPEMETGGCLAEEIIGGEEARFWLESKTLDEYFKKWSSSFDRKVVLNERKLPKII